MAAGQRPRWRRVYDDLHAQIETGQLGPGDQVPTELSLAERFGVSRPTVRSALQQLQADGLITAGAGSQGRLVRESYRIVFTATAFERGTYQDDPARAIDQWKADVEAQGWTGAQTITVDWIPASPQIAGLLRIEPGATVLRRRRVRSVSRLPRVREMPVMIADAYLTEEVARRTTTDVDGTEFAPALTERDVVLPAGFLRSIGVHQARHEDWITPRMPTEDEIRLLDLHPGTPVGEHSRVGYDADDRPVRVLVSVWPGDRQIVRYDLPVQ
nr:GntR family transcriptional regulator [Saccharomonospora piscinae]